MVPSSTFQYSLTPILLGLHSMEITVQMTNISGRPSTGIWKGITRVSTNMSTSASRGSRMRTAPPTPLIFSFTSGREARISSLGARLAPQPR